MEYGATSSDEITATPVIVLWDQILMLPIVGTVDSTRGQEMMATMLAKIQETEAKIIILDILGVATVDSGVASHLIKISKATTLMGADCIISGISPEIAQTLVQLGVELGEVATRSTLRDALEIAFDKLSLEVRQKGQVPALKRA
ncbi:MAG: STAS domain-containing protein [Pseudomonadales bacterium]